MQVHQQPRPYQKVVDDKIRKERPILEQGEDWSIEDLLKEAPGEGHRCYYF